MADAARLEGERIAQIFALDKDLLDAGGHGKRMARLWVKAGERWRAEPYIEQVLARIQKALAEEMEPTARSAKQLGRAEFYREETGDLDTAHCDWESSEPLPKESGENSPFRYLERAESLREKGDVDAAWGAPQAGLAKSAPPPFRAE